MNEEEVLLTTDQVAVAIGTSADYVRRLLVRDEVKPHAGKRLPGAYKRDAAWPPYWVIPLSALKDFKSQASHRALAVPPACS